MMTTIATNSESSNLFRLFKYHISNVCRCFGKRNSSCHGDKESASVSSKGGRSNKRRKKRKQTVSIDLESGPLELLGDME